MTAKTGKDQVDEVEAVPAEEQAETVEVAETGDAAAAPAAPARPAARRKRRVRVIEVIDDEDLDEVLEALDAEEESVEASAEPAATTAPKPAAPKPAATPATKVVKPRPAALEPPSEEAAKEPVRADAFSLPLVPTVVLAVLVAVLGGLAIWQGTSAHSLSSEQDEREAIGKVASAYGDVAFNYNARNYESQTDKAQELMGGDLLESFKNSTLPSLDETFKNNPEVSLRSETNQVFVGSVDERFATAVVMVDVDFTTKDGATSAPATLLRLALAKIDGEWKVTKQYASGASDQNQRELPTAPTGGASKSPAPDESEKPGD